MRINTVTVLLCLLVTVSNAHGWWYTTNEPSTQQASCRHNCGWHMGSCSCYSSCIYHGNCCPDFYDYCQATTEQPTTYMPEPSTQQASCRHNCGWHMGSCSCYSSCIYHGNCCPDFYDYCQATTEQPTTYMPEPSTQQASCRHNCGWHMGSCSCYSSCIYHGNCCPDFYDYCQATTEQPTTYMPGHPPCGGNLYGSGFFSSPYYPNYYHDNLYCVWNITVPHGQRVSLTFEDVQLENCCACDYISVYDGPSTNSPPLGTICFNGNNGTYQSSSTYMTVLFRTDSSVVSRGFRAEYTGSLSESSGRVDCSTDNMNIVIHTSYLSSFGYSGHDLYLNDQKCRPQVSYNQVVFSFPLNTCGTVREFKNSRVVYTNDVRAYKSPNGEITRQSTFQLRVGCQMEQNAQAQILYNAKENINGTISGTGRFNATMAFYTSGSFTEQVHVTPYVVTLNDYLYVKVQLRRSDSSLVLFLDTCVASPSPHDFVTRAYDLVRNGCRRDDTYFAYSSGTESNARFRFKAFQFLRTHSSVYLQCQVAVCKAHDIAARCSLGCRTRKARSLTSTHQSTTVVLGPIQLKDFRKPGEKTPEHRNHQMNMIANV